MYRDIWGIKGVSRGNKNGPTLPLIHWQTTHGPHLIGFVEETAPTPLEQELDVLVNTAARKLSGQIEAVITQTQTHIKIQT